MPAGRLTTHALDLTTGRPASNLKIVLWSVIIAPESESEHRRRHASTHTNADGRTDAPLLAGDDFAPGTYELVFHVGDYFGLPAGGRFLDRVPVRFTVTDAAGHYHVPLLTTPWAYQTYRGS